MTMQIHQMNVSYNPEEDRLRLLINTSDNKEFCFLLTRRFLKILFEVLDKNIEARLESNPVSDDAKKAIRQMEHEKEIGKSNFNKVYEKASERPLGDEPIMAHGLKVKSESGNLLLGIADKNKKGITLTFNQTMLHSLYQILLKATMQADWDLMPKLVESSASVASSGGGQVH